MVRWSGRAMGADATMLLSGVGPERAQAVFSACETEIDRLEGLFSLYRPDSTLSRLNRDGLFEDASADFVALIETALKVAALTGGAFDPTVQPLWRLYADHFREGGDPSGPMRQQIELASPLVDYRSLKVGGALVSFAKPGMTATFNGIAQGYMTDQITALLKAAGIEHVLVNMGEYRALGGHPDGTPWRVGIRDPRLLFETIEAMPLEDAALATSGGYGTRFDQAGRFHHLFDPKTGTSANRYSSVTVRHPSATWADALSTAFYSMSEAGMSGVLAGQGGATALVVRRDGQMVRLG